MLHRAMLGGSMAETLERATSMRAALSKDNFSGSSFRVEARVPSNALIIRYPVSYCSALIRRPPNKKGKRVLLGYLGGVLCFRGFQPLCLASSPLNHAH